MRQDVAGFSSNRSVDPAKMSMAEVIVSLLRQRARVKVKVVTPVGRRVPKDEGGSSTPLQTQQLDFLRKPLALGLLDLATWGEGEGVPTYKSKVSVTLNCRQRTH